MTFSTWKRFRKIKTEHDVAFYNTHTHPYNTLPTLYNNTHGYIVVFFFFVYFWRVRFVWNVKLLSFHNFGKLLPYKYSYIYIYRSNFLLHDLCTAFVNYWTVHVRVFCFYSSKQQQPARRKRRKFKTIYTSIDWAGGETSLRTIFRTSDKFVVGQER